MARDASSSSVQASRPSRPASPLKNGYLIFYNIASAIAWSVVLSRTISTVILRGHAFTYPELGQYTKWTQTMAVIEVFHSLFGIVRAPLATTALQVLSRIILVWAVVDPFPFVALSPFYSSMLFAWSVTEVIRYSYFALNLSGWHPRFMTWLRYNTFFVLYPIGISSEWALCYQALGPASKISDLHKYTFYVILFIYFPGAYVLYTYMMKQRRKVMRNLNKPQDEKANQ